MAAGHMNLSFIKSMSLLKQRLAALERFYRPQVLPKIVYVRLGETKAEALAREDVPPDYARIVFFTRRAE